MTQSNTTPATHKPTGKPLLPPKEQEYVYHWGRIFGVVVLLLVLGGLAAYGYQSWFASSPQEDAEMAEIPPKSKLAADDQQVDQDPANQLLEDIPEPFSRGEQETLPAEIAETADSMPGSQETVKPLLEEAIIQGDDQLQETVTDKLMETHPPLPESSSDSAAELAGLETTGEVATKPVYFVDSEILTETETAEELPAAPSQDEMSQPEAGSSAEIPMDSQAESVGIEDREITSEPATGPFQLGELKILNPRAKRFLLARAISNREPLGELQDIRFKADGSAVVWAYSEVIDMQGRQLNYVWLHEDSEVARVPVNIRANRWRSYSSKTINQSMSGAWRVELQDGQGRLLASAEFF